MLERVVQDLFGGYAGIIHKVLSISGAPNQQLVYPACDEQDARSTLGLPALSH